MIRREGVCLLLVPGAERGFPLPLPNARNEIFRNGAAKVENTVLPLKYALTEGLPHSEMYQFLYLGTYPMP